MYAAISCNVEAWDMDPANLLFWGGKNAKHLFFQSEKSTLSLVFTVKKAKHPHFFKKPYKAFFFMVKKKS